MKKKFNDNQYDTYLYSKGGEGVQQKKAFPILSDKEGNAKLKHSAIRVI